VKARYYGEVTYLDYCLGRILDAVETRPNSENVHICFFSDHGDLLGIITAGRNKISLRRPAAFLRSSVGQPRCLREPSELNL